MPPADIMRLADSFDGIVAVDEAYVDFSPYPSVIPLIASHPNIIVLQTFSKAWGLANLRVGMAFSDPRIATIFANVKYPYNLNGPTQREILRQLSRDITPQVEMIKSERERLAAELAKYPCVERVYHSDANFLLVKVDDAGRLYDSLVAKGVLVRNRTRVAHCAGTLRITIGTPAENRRLLEALADYCGMLRQESQALTPRTATIERHTSETDIRIHIDLDGDPSASVIDTGLKFFDHMLSQLPITAASLSTYCVAATSRWTSITPWRMWPSHSATPCARPLATNAASNATASCCRWTRAGPWCSSTSGTYRLQMGCHP